MKMKLLPREFYLNSDVCFLAKTLLGKVLRSSIDGKITSGIIVETEAYRGPDDKASHSFNHRRTPRNESMYLPGGNSYVYLCYGIHNLFNVVTAEKDVAHAVLIRALEPLEGIDIMLKRRNLKSKSNIITKGPGSLSQALGINKNHDAKLLYSASSAVQIHDYNLEYYPEDIGISTRIGVESSGSAALYPWRFFIKNSLFVSAHKKTV